MELLEERNELLEEGKKLYEIKFDIEKKLSILIKKIQSSSDMIDIYHNSNITKYLGENPNDKDRLENFYQTLKIINGDIKDTRKKFNEIKNQIAEYGTPQKIQTRISHCGRDYVSALMQIGSSPQTARKEFQNYIKGDSN